MTYVNEGEAFVAGTDPQTAQKLLAAAEKAGLDPSVVRISPGDGGFVVPQELAGGKKADDKDDEKDDEKAEEPPRSPKRSTTEKK